MKLKVKATCLWGNLKEFVRNISKRMEFRLRCKEDPERVFDLKGSNLERLMPVTASVYASIFNFEAIRYSDFWLAYGKDKLA